jgi:hypothetical protein
MKKLSFLVLALILLSYKQSIGQGNLKMQGAYFMTKQLANDGSGDSLLNNEQFKIYTDRYMIYAAPVSKTDSTANYGIGTYNIKGGKVIENVFYTSSGGNKKDTFAVEISKMNNGYKQVVELISDDNKKFLLTEEYKNVGKPVTSPLDGAWQQIKRIEIGKDDTVTINDPVQFKVYQSGHFSWASSSPDSASNKIRSVFGYGTFTMNGKSKSKEVNTNSTFRSFLINRPMELTIEFLGKDSYKQTIEGPDGSKSIEIYKRLP